MARFDSILQTIGRTPVVRIERLAPAGVSLWVKVEAMNPLGSVKDRLALGIIEDAERSGKLAPGQTVIEATSGNTGIGLAMVCARKGYPLVVVMGENFSIERRRLMRYLGARVVLTPAAAKGMGMLAKAVELAEAHGWFLCRQFESEANADVHANTTAREILEDFGGDRLDYWVTGAGTGGTLKGVSRVLRRERPGTKIVVCEPANSRMLASELPQPRAADGSIKSSHPLFRPHLFQGWSPDFIAKLTEDALASGYVDRIVPVDAAEAMRLSRELARKEGIFTGTTGGATFAGALTICSEAPAGATVLCMLPDTGERYLSTPLFDGIAAEMNDEELEISNSTSSCRFEDQPAAALPAPAAPTPAVASAETDDEITRLLADPARPVVMFAFEWCEFCWSVRKLFARCGVTFTAVDLDSAELQRDDRGGRLRRAVGARTGTTTIPQVFVGGELVGGATDVFEAFRSGRLQELFTRHDVAFDAAVRLDPATLLPSWLQPRRPQAP